MGWIRPTDKLPDTITRCVVLFNDFGMLRQKFAVYFPCDKFFQIDGDVLSNITESNIEYILGYIIIPNSDDFKEYEEL